MSTVHVQDCHKCAGCCSDPEVTEEEVELIKEQTGLLRSWFVREVRHPEVTLLMLQSLDDRCMFLTETPDGYTCDIYDYRPETCMRFPTADHQLSLCERERRKRSLPVLNQDTYKCSC
ncbi:MAG: YkgJ family cysteine cluster protein [Candidatus Woesearchaeota archaeon]|nr:YkgJ family cysteine cluster protein [Candidatus Woesearchaeota archaeon]